ncbi:hypothetical protein D3C87_1604830 [compost metagenome]
MAWAWACGRLKVPPRVWHNLWWTAIPTEPRQIPANHAPCNAWPRASTFCGSSTIFGSACAKARIDSSAINEITGLASSAYRASIAWAMAFMPEQADIPTGRVNVSSGS